MDESSVPLRQDEDTMKPNQTKVAGGEDDEEKVEIEEDEEPGFKKKGLVYGVNDRPPFNITIVCAFQVSVNTLLQF